MYIIKFYTVVTCHSGSLQNRYVRLAIYHTWVLDTGIKSGLCMENAPVLPTRMAPKDQEWPKLMKEFDKPGARSSTKLELEEY